MTCLSRTLLLSLVALTAGPAFAESLLATRMIRPGDVIVAADLVPGDVRYPGTISAKVDAVGFEARVTLFPGRPLTPQDLGPPRLVRRNELVTLVYQSASIDIRTEGRSLSDGVAGDIVQVMNIESRTRLTGVVSPTGQIIVNGRN